jgi:hypothetical protein
MRTRRLRKQRGGTKSKAAPFSRMKSQLSKSRKPIRGTITRGPRLRPKQADMPVVAKNLDAELLSGNKLKEEKEKYKHQLSLKTGKTEEGNVELAKDIAPLIDKGHLIGEKSFEARDIFEFNGVDEQCNAVIKPPKADDRCYICGYRMIPNSRYVFFKATCEHLLPVRYAVLLLALLPRYEIREGEKIPAKKLLESEEYKKMLEMEYKWAHNLCNGVKDNYMFIKEIPSKPNTYEVDKEKIKNILFNINYKFVNEYRIKPVDINKRAKIISEYFEIICDYLNNRVLSQTANLHTLAGVATAAHTAQTAVDAIYQRKLLKGDSIAVTAGTVGAVAKKAASRKSKRPTSATSKVSNKTRRASAPASSRASRSRARGSKQAPKSRAVSHARGVTQRLSAASQRSKKSQSKQVEGHRRSKRVAALAAPAASLTPPAQPPKRRLSAIPEESKENENMESVGSVHELPGHSRPSSSESVNNRENKAASALMKFAKGR